MAAKGRSAAKRPIESYERKSKKRVNNPPVGLVTPDTDPDAGAKKTYRYDPHIDPALSWDQQAGRKEIEERYAHLRGLLDALAITNKALREAESGNTDDEEVEALRAEADRLLAEARNAAAELEKPQLPYLNWAGKAEHTSFELPTVSLHVHERIDPRTIIEAVRKRNGSAGDEHMTAEACIPSKCFSRKRARKRAGRVLRGISRPRSTKS